MALRIEQYAVIGDTQTCALVGDDGSVDWLCWPRFDSDACFAGLLGHQQHGRWLVAPTGDAEVKRRYRGATLILETDFEVEGGAVRVIDFMPPRASAPTLARIVCGLRGQVSMRTELAVRFEYGDRTPWVRAHEGGCSALAGPDAVWLRTGVPIRIAEGTAVSEFTVSEGQRVALMLEWFPSHAIAPDPDRDAEVLLEETESWWRRWSEQCTYEGPFREAVQRSLITLKALTYSPTGGIVAAATTSLPEHLGGVRNWDYRFCWVRDATFTLLALMDAGYLREACAWRDWLVRTVAGEPHELQIAYGLGGEKRIPEIELPWLPGYQGARPVRIGNAAAGQLQLDVFGETMDCLHQARQHGLEPIPDVWPIQRGLLEFLEEKWQQPDEGIWEVRAERRHFTHSKVMAWVAVDRSIRDAERCGFDAPIERWKALRARIHEEVCRNGFDPQQNAFVQSYGSRTLDASLLLIPLVGFLPAYDPRVLGTVDAIEKRLVCDGFVYRYDTREAYDGLPPGEGVFLACSLWLADCLLLQGRRDDALAYFERVLALRNDVGLLSEEYDPHSRRLVGNFPQAFSHVALVDTALNLCRISTGPAQQRKRD